MSRESMNGVEFRKAVLNEVNLSTAEEELKLKEKQVQAVIDAMRYVVVESILEGKDVVLRDFVKFYGTEKEASEKKVFGDKTVTVHKHTAIACKMADTVKKEVKDRSSEF